jgi:hypothetical protein
MLTSTVCPTTHVAIPHLVLTTGQPDRGNTRASLSAESLLMSRRLSGRRAKRVLIRPEPGFYVMRLVRGAPLVPALIYLVCPLVVPQLGVPEGPHPDDWCRPLDRPLQCRAQIDGKPVPVDQVWTARSLRPISSAEYQFRIGALRQWARMHPRMPEARPQLLVDLTALPPLF